MPVIPCVSDPVHAHVAPQIDEISMSHRSICISFSREVSHEQVSHEQFVCLQVQVNFGCQHGFLGTLLNADKNPEH